MRGHKNRNVAIEARINRLAHYVYNNDAEEMHPYEWALIRAFAGFLLMGEWAEYLDIYSVKLCVFDGNAHLLTGDITEARTWSLKVEWEMPAGCSVMALQQAITPGCEGMSCTSASPIDRSIYFLFRSKEKVGNNPFVEGLDGVQRREMGLAYIMGHIFRSAPRLQAMPPEGSIKRLERL